MQMFLMRFRWYRMWMVRRAFESVQKIARQAGWSDERINQTIPRYRERV
jgi:hypothetical protein